MNTAINTETGPIVVTGSAGHSGSHLVQNLVRHGYDVRRKLQAEGRA